MEVLLRVFRLGKGVIFIALNQGLIIIYCGDMGSGKTLSCVRQAYAYHKLGYTIYSNFKLFFPFVWLDKELIRKMIRQEYEIENAVILLDEIHQIADSRMSGSKKNLWFGYLVQMSRNKSVRLLATTQYFSQVDVRLRLATALVVNCSKKLYESRMRCRNEICKKVAPEEFQPLRITEFWGNPYFTMYNTDESIHLADLDIKDTKEEKEEKERKRKERNAEIKDAEREAKEQERIAKQVKRNEEREEKKGEKAQEQINKLQEALNKRFLLKN